MSLPDDDGELLGRDAAEHGMGSRSAALHRAVRPLRAGELGPAYERAWADWVDWAGGGDRDLWETTTADGLG